MILLSSSNINPSHRQQLNQNYYSNTIFPEHYQDEADIIDDIPALDFDFADSYKFAEATFDCIKPLNSSSTYPMQSDSWGSLAHIPAKTRRFSHQRESSLSSLGSTGPASPYTQNMTSPHIAMSDPTFDGVADNPFQDYTNGQANAYYQLAKSIGPASYPAYNGIDSGTVMELAYSVAAPGPDRRPRMEKGLLPAPELGGTRGRSHPNSLTSSVTGDSPASPVTGESDQMRRRKHDYSNNIPRLDRTMTDVYGDELYNPNFAITSTSSPKTQSVTSMGSDVFSQRLSAANHQHLSAAHSPASSASRARSPFQTGSPFATSTHNGGVSHSVHRFGTSQHTVEQEQNRQRQLSQLENPREPETPKTISPKDAVLEFNESEADGIFPLFPQDGSSFEIDSLNKPMVPPSSDGTFFRSSAIRLDSGNQSGYLPSQIPTGIHVPQQYPFIARPPLSNDTPPPRLSSSGPSSVTSGGNTPNRGRPRSTGAEGGTYTCTYHGCTLRFETPTLLQKHKREGHRQTQGLGAPRAQDVGMTSTLLNTQAGPHKCDRINPSTGKACNTVFSRPYDLTRHEDTIHNGRKQKVRCNLCTEEKTFSRADALTRHYRVCHPEMELPGKSRRRGS